jgi:alpha-amylase
MEQKMLRVSREIAALKEDQGSGVRDRKERERLIQEAERALYAGQCNCAYWHGVFGGLYLGHLRRAVYGQLIGAERLAGQAAGNRLSSVVEDADGDGQEELVVKTPDQTILLDPAEGGTIVEWSLLQPAVNLLDTLSRRPEPYHEKLRSAKAHAQAGQGGAPASIHDALGVKEANLDEHLLYDTQRRSAFIDYAFDSMPSLEEARRSSWTERRLWPSAPFQLLPQPSRRRASEPVTGVLTRELPGGGRVRKTVRVPVDEPAFECLYEADGADIPVIALEFNLSLRDERYLHQPAEVAQASEFSVEEPDTGISARLSIEPVATLWHFPVETVSESEQGMERTYQGLAVICLWSPPRGGAWRCRVRWTAR